jgi:hypothetical protein
VALPPGYLCSQILVSLLATSRRRNHPVQAALIGVLCSPKPRSLDLSAADLPPPPSGSLRAARLEIERLMSARHAVLSQGAKQVPPHFLAWPEAFGRTDSKRCRRSREINDFHLPPAQTPRTLFRDHYGISEIRRHLSSFDADV